MSALIHYERNGPASRLAAGPVPLSFAVILAFAVAVLTGGCAGGPYRYGRFHPQEPDGVSRNSVVVQRGKPHKTLDRIAWLVGFPERVFTLNAKASNHEVSAETLEKLTKYLEENDLSDVYVAVNEYDPKTMWRRLQENDRVSPFWRYSAGTLTWLGYLFVPNRVFGGDEYNPYTNTLNITSDVPALVLSEAAYAKEVHKQKLPGLYALAGETPVLSLWRRASATSDVLAYTRLQNDWEGEKEAHHVLYAHIGSTAFEPATHFVPVVGPFISAGGAVAGHAIGRTITAVRAPKPGESPTEREPGAPLAGVARLSDMGSSSDLLENEPEDDGRIIPVGFDEDWQPPGRIRENSEIDDTQKK